MCKIGRGDEISSLKCGCVIDRCLLYFLVLRLRSELKSFFAPMQRLRFLTQRSRKIFRKNLLSWTDFFHWYCPLVVDNKTGNLFEDFCLSWILQRLLPTLTKVYPQHRDKCSTLCLSNFVITSVIMQNHFHLFTDSTALSSNRYTTMVLRVIRIAGL